MKEGCYWILFATLACLLYMLHCTSQKRDFQILQTPLRSLTDSMLHEKYPILVYEQVRDLSYLIRNVFRFQYLFLARPTWEPSKLIRVRTRFILLHNLGEEDIAISIGPNEQTMIPMSMEPHNLLILPAGWYFRSDQADSLASLALNDLSHRLFLGY